jgi:hypothetical protein
LYHPLHIKALYIRLFLEFVDTLGMASPETPNTANRINPAQIMIILMLLSTRAAAMRRASSTIYN